MGPGIRSVQYLGASRQKHLRVTWKDGRVGILPRHAPLVTALSFGELRYKKEGEEFSFAIGGGFLQVADNKVIVLADTAEAAQDIDVERARGLAAAVAELAAVLGRSPDLDQARRDFHPMDVAPEDVLEAIDRWQRLVQGALAAVG